MENRLKKKKVEFQRANTRQSDISLPADWFEVGCQKPGMLISVPYH